MLIINADDFGKDSLTNRAIIQSFKKGLCSSTTIMPNMPGFKEACHWAYDNNLIDHIGIHIVLTEGHPLTENIKHCLCFCTDKGLLSFSRNKRTFFYLTSSENKALAEEIRAQIKRCRDYGIKITHLDSHSHIHTEWTLSSIIIKIAQEEKIPYIRISRNCGAGLSFYKKVYKNIFNWKLKKASLARTDYFGSLEDYFFEKRLRPCPLVLDSFEIMIHPTLDANNNLIDAQSADNELLEASITEINLYKEAVSFGGKKYLYEP